MKLKCSNCHREIEYEKNVVMVQCACGEGYDVKKDGDKNGETNR